MSRRYRHHIPAPPKPTPGHAESYNPPPEYLFTEHEVDTVLLFIVYELVVKAVYNIKCLRISEGATGLFKQRYCCQNMSDRQRQCFEICRKKFGRRKKQKRGELILFRRNIPAFEWCRHIHVMLTNCLNAASICTFVHVKERCV